MAINKGNTKAWIQATSISWAYTIKGIIIGNSKFNKEILIVPTAAISIASKIHPEVIFQNNLNEREIIFAPSPIISKTHRNNEIIISNIFTIKKRNVSIIGLCFPFSYGI